MNKKHAERIAVFALAAFLIGYFIYQVAYGMPMTMGPNGTMTMTQANITAQFNAPPGSTINNFTIMPHDNFTTMELGNTTWTIYNATTGSTGTISFEGHFLHRLNKLHPWHLLTLTSNSYCC
jgi:hypothetical protein